ncbi:hypothetical protein GCM10010399_78550 [Dactylosporangium fulvum]|uniref:LPXTG cell wall anchor domain-containing protein n=1 Tax=Dactylosporangium fulvum TaxID=53359 RepID=A0ABY5W0P2_9ACTN|nr:LPXTG cell wall anchor domain-containing protein [Dactylosporangium fulvum]UWP82666.1 LPXTG cell wall anchor domain-containing protein [Dactylosporangium fulvum]
MKLRGITRFGAAAAATTFVVAGLGAPADARGPLDEVGVPVLSTQPTTADAFETKDCSGIADGKPATDAQGWLYSTPAGAGKVVNYVFFYKKNRGDGDWVPLLLNDKGIFLIDVDLNALKAVAPGDKKALVRAAGEEEPVPGEDDFPVKPAPAGVSGKLTGKGGWVRTPDHWNIEFGFAETDPFLEEGSFELVSTCLKAVAATPTSASPSPSAGPQLPVTGSNVPLLSGIGGGLVVIGAVLFLTYRRRRNIKFVA